MFQARISPVSEFRKLLYLVEAVTDTANLEITPEGIAINTSNNTKIIQINLRLLPSYFVEFNATSNISLGISLESLVKVVRLCDEEDTLTLQSSHSSSLVIVSESLHKPKICEFSLNLMEIPQSDEYIGLARYTCNLQVPSKDIQQLCKDLRGVSQFLQITVTGTRVHMGIFSDTAEGWIQFYLTKGQNGVKIKTSHRVSADLNVNCLRKILKAASVADKVFIRIDQDSAVKFEFPIRSAELFYYLAPAIE